MIYHLFYNSILEVVSNHFHEIGWSQESTWGPCGGDRIMRRWGSCLGSWLLPRFFHRQCLANSLSLPFSRYVHIFIQNHWRINCRRSAPLLLNISTFENRNILLVDHGTIIRFSRFSPETIPLSTVHSLKSAVVL